MLLSEIITAIGASCQIDKDIDIQHLLTDSRSLSTPASSTLFFALHTEKNDGAKYISELYKRGIRTAVVEKNSRSLVPASCPCTLIEVDNALLALQQLAAYKRSKYNCPVIGITGSNGKTVVKEWLYQLLKDDYCITRSPRSYNSQIGVPLSVWQMNEQTTLAIFEAGISEPGEMEHLEPIIRPTIGVITYIGAEHGENFLSLEQKREEKMRLFAHCPLVIEEPTHQNVRTCADVLRALGYDEERIEQMLLQKTHETVMQVNLSALASNVASYRALLKPSTKMVCMVKAYAYGAGDIEVARCLQDHGVDYLAVAVCDEGVELRREGIHIPIIIMDPEETALKTILSNNLEPNIYSFQSLANIIHAAEEEGLENYPIHIKIDSGMHRLGFEYADMERLIAVLSSQRYVRVRSIFSHLAGADERQFDEFTLHQITRFSRCAERLTEGLRYPIIRHILNSAGIERFTAYQYDMVRLGIGMYGFSVSDRLALRNVCTLKTTLLSVKEVKKGESIGYGRHTYLDEDREVAVIPIGYADGFDRRFGNHGGEVLVRGKRCPVLGNVCMDLAIIDVTGTDAKPGDEAIIFGDKLPVEELANKLGTITYEILTSVSRRVKRVYFYE